MVDRQKYEAWLRDVIARAKAVEIPRTKPGQDPDVLGAVLRSDRLQRVGTWAEFGVADGTSLRRIASMRGQARVWGFDTFSGLPEDWKRKDDCVHLKGHFSQDVIPKVPGAHIVTGLFEDVLPSWHPPTPITFVNVDCDLYAGASAVLRHCAPKLAQGAIVYFDEVLVYPGFEEHEALAFYEATLAGLRWEMLVAGGEKFAVVCAPPAVDGAVFDSALDPPEVDPATGRDPGDPSEPSSPH